MATEKRTNGRAIPSCFLGCNSARLANEGGDDNISTRDNGHIHLRDGNRRRGGTGGGVGLAAGSSIPGPRSRLEAFGKVYGMGHRFIHHTCILKGGVRFRLLFSQTHDQSRLHLPEGQRSRNQGKVSAAYFDRMATRGRESGILANPNGDMARPQPVKGLFL